MTEPKGPRYAWTQLYEARKSPRYQIAEKTSVGRGRPERLIPVRKSTLYLSAGDEAALKKWQHTFSVLLGRKPSTGETAGILAKIVAERFSALDLHDNPDSLDALVAALVGMDSAEMDK
jgi:hypothetical protein